MEGSIFDPTPISISRTKKIVDKTTFLLFAAFPEFEIEKEQQLRKKFGVNL